MIERETVMDRENDSKGEKLSERESDRKKKVKEGAFSSRRECAFEKEKELMRERERKNYHLVLISVCAYVCVLVLE